MQIFSILVTLNPFMKPSACSLGVQRASRSMEKIHFLQGSRVAAVSVPLAEPCVLSRTITEDSISNELHVEAEKKTSALDIWYTSSEDVLSSALLLRAGGYMRVRACEGSWWKVDSLRCSSTYFLYLCWAMLYKFIYCQLQLDERFFCFPLQTVTCQHGNCSLTDQSGSAVNTCWRVGARRWIGRWYPLICNPSLSV